MTGHTRGGDNAGQREKIYAILRSQDKWMGVYEIMKICHRTGDKALISIKPPTIRRCLQELRDGRPSLVKNDRVNQEWLAVPLSDVT